MCQPTASARPSRRSSTSSSPGTACACAGQGGSGRTPTARRLIIQEDRTIFFSVYQEPNQHRTRQFARVDAASRWLDEQMPSNAELAGTCFINEVGEFVESELRAAGGG